jgi:hypothetical protein
VGGYFQPPQAEIMMLRKPTTSKEFRPLHRAPMSKSTCPTNNSGMATIARLTPMSAAPAMMSPADINACFENILIFLAPIHLSKHA